MIERYFKEDSRFVYVRFSGDVSDEQIAEHIHAFNEEAVGREGLLELADARAVTDISGMSVTGLMGSAPLEHGQARSTGGKLAAVVSTTVNYGMSRAFTTFVEPYREATGVFYSLEDAVAWLGTTESVEEIKEFILHVTSDA